MKSKSNIIGYVTNKSDNLVVGYAFNPIDKRPVLVNFKFRDTIVASCLADQEHKSLRSTNAPDHCGFKFELKEHGVFHLKDDFQVEAAGAVLPYTPGLSMRLMESGFFDLSKKKPFFFMHIPKTAGTSFRYLLYKIFDQSVIYPNRSDIKENANKYPLLKDFRELDQSIKQEIELYMGHYPLWVIKYIPEVPNIITFLRKPEEQIVSLVKHMKRRNPLYADLSLEIIAEKYVRNDPQCHFFLNQHQQDCELNDRLYEIVKLNLNRCDFVGVTELFGQGLNRLQELFSWSFDSELTKNQSPREEVSQRLRELAHEKTHWDRKLYDLVLDRFRNMNY